MFATLFRHTLLFSYVGSKVRLFRTVGLAEAIRQEPHKTYVSVFGGSAACLLCKYPSKVEIYNDLDKCLYALFTVLKDKTQREALIELLTYTLFHPSEMWDAYYAQDTTEDPILLAWSVLTLRNLSRCGHYQPPSFYRYRRPQRWQNLRGYVRDVAERFRKVTCRNISWQQCLKRYAKPDLEPLLFLDPPYHEREGFYPVKFLPIEHDLLALSLANLRPGVKAILCGLDTPAYDRYLPHWHKTQWVRKDRLGSQLPEQQTVTEYLWHNFPLSLSGL